MLRLAHLDDRVILHPHALQARRVLLPVVRSLLSFALRACELTQQVANLQLLVLAQIRQAGTLRRGRRHVGSRLTDAGSGGEEGADAFPRVRLLILLGAIVQGRRVRHGHLELRTKITEDTRALHEALHKKVGYCGFISQ